MKDIDVKNRLDMIQQVAEQIRLLSVKQDAQFYNMLQIFDIPTDQPTKLQDWLFDYCYNQTDYVLDIIKEHFEKNDI